MLTKENKKAIVENLDALIKLNGVMEVIDGPALSLGIGYLDSGVLSKINAAYHDRINEAIRLGLIEKQYEEALDEVSSVLADAIDTPLIDGTPEENEAYQSLLQLLYNVLVALLTKHDQVTEVD